jgi:hypothetical protein
MKKDLESLYNRGSKGSNWALVPQKDQNMEALCSPETQVQPEFITA